MFTRIQWRIAASYIVLLAVVFVALGAYLANSQGTAFTALTAAFTGAVALAMIAAVIVARVTTRQLATLTQAVRQAARGRLDVTIPVLGRDEVSQLARAFNEMSARLRDDIRALEDERERTGAVLRHMADGLLIVDPGGIVRLVNPAAARLLGVTPSYAEGRSAMTVLRDHKLAEVVMAAAVGATATYGPAVVELGPRRQRRFVQAVASRIPVTAGSGPQVLLMLQDVTELQQSEIVRREFVANVSHELRTPVASLKALAETLADGALDDPPAARDFLKRMEVEVDGLAQMVEELLELSRIESGQVALHRERVDLLPVIRGAAERLRPQAERQGVKLEIDACEDGVVVEADPERLQHIVVNLVHNGIKFTPPGGSIAVSVARVDDEAVVSVADTGAGIAAEALPRVFERFYKQDRARSGGGTGLGLAVAKHEVQAHGGRIWAESPGEGQGSTFRFAIPVASEQRVP